jgi:riboflavin kinase/FMN adenylyltransferase
MLVAYFDTNFNSVKISSVWLVKSSQDQVITPTAIALGNFDGIHLGHQKVIRSIWNCSEQLQTQTNLSSQDLSPQPFPCATLVTFHPHPREFFSGEKTQLLTPLSEKMQFLGQLGIEQLVLLPFDRELATLTPQEFVEQILVNRLRAKRISIGEDFRFGHQRAGDAEQLKAIATELGIEVWINSLETKQEIRVSSSQIRQALATGKIIEANQMLGRAYILTGRVVKGQQLGRTLGFPTANLDIPADKLLPRYGVYCVQVQINAGGQFSPVQLLPGVMNIGCRPTVAGERPTVEVYLLDWRGDLYDCNLTVSLEYFLRPEQKFASLADLKARIAQDCQQAKQILQA